MTPNTHGSWEILLDTPDGTDYVVSAYVDLRVRDGFRNYADAFVRNEARGAANALPGKAHKALDENIEAVHRAIASIADHSLRGLAVFSSVARKLEHVVPLHFAVEHRLVIDENPFIMPLLEKWHGEPRFLIVAVDGMHARFFETSAGVPEAVDELSRDTGADFEGGPPRFHYKKRLAQQFHERLKGLDEDGFFRETAALVAAHWGEGCFDRLVLIGRQQAVAALRSNLAKEIAERVFDPAHSALPDNLDQLAPVTEKATGAWRAEHEIRLAKEISERRKRGHLIGDGASETLDALQQGRAAEIVLGRNHNLEGARCTSCGYRFGAPTGVCVYCGGKTTRVAAEQEILRLATRHRVPFYIYPAAPEPDPVGPQGVVSLLHAEANWAPTREAADASLGR